MSWIDFINEEKQKDYYKNLQNSLEIEYREYTCFPKYENIFHAFDKTPIENVKVVILGQDPYHDVNQANGLAFGINSNAKLPPSLRNIAIELENDLNVKLQDYSLFS